MVETELGNQEIPEQVKQDLVGHRARGGILSRVMSLVRPRQAQKHERSLPPDIQTIIRRHPDFDRQHEEYLKKHQDEEFTISGNATERSIDQGPYTFAIVKRAYRELSNGNLTTMLKSLVHQVPEGVEAKDYIRGYIAVNNWQVWAVAAEVLSNHDEVKRLVGYQKVKALFDLIQEKYTNDGIKLSRSDHHEYWNEAKNLDKKIKDFEENQATLRILEQVTIAVNNLIENREAIDARAENEIIKKALDNISEDAVQFLTDSQRQALRNAAFGIMKKRIPIMGVDCSSAEKAEQNTMTINMPGKATNQAAHIAVAQGAQFVDVSDMDQYHASEGLRELYDISQTRTIDFFIRPLLTTAPQHPEQIKDSDNIWANLVQYYANSFGEETVRYGNKLDQTSGSFIVSSDAFRSHPYPEKWMDEDFTWYRTMEHDSSLEKYYGLSLPSRMIRGERGRDVSFDGEGLGEDSTTKRAFEIREILDRKNRKKARKWIRANNALENELQQLTGRFPELLKEYTSRRSDFFHEHQERRRQARWAFLGIDPDGPNNDADIQIDNNSPLARLYSFFIRDPQISAQSFLEVSRLPYKERAFFEQNPLIIPGILQELRRLQNNNGEVPSLRDVINYVEFTLPELFARPLTQEPDYSGEDVNNWVHLFQSVDWFARHIGALKETGEFRHYPREVQQILHRFEWYKQDIPNFNEKRA